MKTTFLPLLILLMATACSSGSNNGGGGTSTSVVDVAIGSIGFSSNSTVNLYFNILAFTPAPGAQAFPTPDVVLDQATSLIHEPDSVILTQNDLIVCDGEGLFGGGDDTVKVWRDYRSLADNAAPDMIFTNGGPLAITDPVQCVYDADTDTLVVANAGANNVLLFQDFSTIGDGTNPSATVVTLNNAGSLTNDPTGVAVADADLYVANQANAAPGAACVSIYRDITTLADAAAPDVTLDWDVSFFPNSAGNLLEFCTEVAVGNNFDSNSTTLYVTSVVGEMFVFEDAGQLTSNALPDAIIFGDSGELSAPIKALPVGSEVLVPNLNLAFLQAILGGGPGAACDGAPGVAGFGRTSTGLVTGQTPNLTIGPDHGIASVFELDFAGDALFVVSQSECVPFPADTTGVQIYRGAAAYTAGAAPTLVIPGSASGNTDLQYAFSLDAIERDAGT